MRRTYYKVVKDGPTVGHLFPTGTIIYRDDSIPWPAGQTMVSLGGHHIYCSVKLVFATINDRQYPVLVQVVEDSDVQPILTSVEDAHHAQTPS